MKIYSDFDICVKCGEDFDWCFINYEHKSGQGLQISGAYIKNPETAYCKRKIVIPRERELFVGCCPHCGQRFEIECNSDILKELYS